MFAPKDQQIAYRPGRPHQERRGQRASPFHVERSITTSGGGNNGSRSNSSGPSNLFGEGPLLSLNRFRFIQPKLNIGAVNDPLESEADRVAESVMSLRTADVTRSAATAKIHRKCSSCEEEQSVLSASKQIQRMCASCKEEDSVSSAAPAQLHRKCAACEDEDKLLQKKADQQRVSGKLSEAPAIVHDALRSSGQPLDPKDLAFFQPRFGFDLSHVRIHADTTAAESARSIGALAYTSGSDIAFASGHYQPGTDSGRRLVAHELAHVLQQGLAPATAMHSHMAGESTMKTKNLRTSLAPDAGRLQRKPQIGKDSPKTENCPAIERGEKEEAAKGQLHLIERIPQQEWLIYGFPIGGSDISEIDAGQFISNIVRSLMQGHFVYMTGQDPLQVLGFTDCFAGPQVDNHLIRKLRAAKFCDGVKHRYASTPKTYPALIRSCEPAAADQYVGSNATRADRAQNRSILIRRAAAEIQSHEENQGFPYDPKFGPNEAHCVAYSSSLARDILGPVYSNNAHCSCLVTPDEPHNNCVRFCLQDKIWTLLANAYPGRGPNDPPIDISVACPIIWKHHRDCYHDCGCASEFIGYPAFDAVCNIALPCAIDSAAINLLNRCMPSTKNDKYLPVDQ